MKLSVIIPVYNELNTLLDILKKVEDVNLDNLQKEIVIVDDFSTDGSRGLLEHIEERESQKENSNYKILYHQSNQGKGSAIRTALNKCDGDFVIIQDADLEYDPADYMTVLNPLINNEAKVVYGSRRLKPLHNFRSGVMFHAGGILLNFVTNILYPNARLTDEPTCYKAFSKETLLELNLESKRFEFCPEVTAKLCKKKIPIIEVPISYSPRKIKDGKKIKYRDGFHAIWTLLKYRFKD